MVGGNQRWTTTVPARIAARLIDGSVALGGMIALGGTISLFGMPTHAFASANADESPSAEQKSVVVATEKVSPDVETPSRAPGVLEPIANVSEYEPDLADPPQAAVPDEAPENDAHQRDESDNDVQNEAIVKPREETVDEPPTEAAESANAEVSPREAESDQVVEGVEKVVPVASAELVEPASFFGATPGQTTRQDLLDSWGEPSDGDAESVTIAYELESFPLVTVGFAGDVVDLIDVRLADPREASELIATLQLGAYQPLIKRNDAGEEVATVVPERGVTLHNSNSDSMAFASDDEANDDRSQILGLTVHSIRAEDFVQRAKSYPRYAFAQREADLRIAAGLNRDHAEARRLLSELTLATGRPAAAERFAAEAVEIDEQVDAYRLQWAKALTDLARYDLAVDQCRDVLDGSNAPQLVRAQALHQMGVLASYGSQEVAKRSVPLHNKAIELADALATDADPEVAMAARELMVEAHLAVAAGIAAGDWRDKDEYVGQWISRASALAEELITEDDAYLPLRLRIATAALSAGSKLQPPIDPQLWIAEAEETIENLASVADDEMARDEFNWQLGVAYCYATEIQHRRGQAASALRYGDLGEAQLAELAPTRNELPDSNFLLGRLYFQIGAVHAVHREDHQAACRWYDRASQRLLTPTPVTNLAAPGRHGDALVSMGVSYWHIGQRQRAVELTQTGLELVEQGVADGLLAESAVAVPEGNLAAMNRALGNVKSLDAPSTPRTQMAGRRTGSVQR